MEYGLIPKINQYRDNHELEIQKIQGPNTNNETLKANDQSKLLEVQREEFSEVSEASEVKKTNLEKSNAQYEVVLTNTNFGFNDSSKDFYVRATRGNAQNQYPTEEMMRLKSYLMSLESV